MPSFAELVSQGASNAWLFIPSAILLGALHGLEPGHSKTMMAAFIVAVRGTVMQAVLLGLAATVSHTIVVWVIAIGGMYLWQGVAPETFEPYLQLVSGVIIITMALWMLWRAREDQRRAKLAAGHDPVIVGTVTAGTGAIATGGTEATAMAEVAAMLAPQQLRHTMVTVKTFGASTLGTASLR